MTIAAIYTVNRVGCEYHVDGYDPKSFRMLKFGPYRSEKEARQVADRLNRDASEREKCARIDRWLAKAGAR